MRRASLSVALVVLSSVVLLAVSATDDFDRPDDNTGLGANWTCPSSSGHFNVFSNAALDNPLTTANTVWCMYTNVTFSVDHASQVHVNGTTGSSLGGPSVRWAGTTTADATGYVAFAFGTGDIKLYRKDSGVDNYALVTTYSATGFVNGDLVALSVTGSTFTVSLNSVDLGSHQTDATYSTGAPGMTAYDPAVGLISMDDWAGADNGSGPTLPTSIFLNNPIRCCGKMPRVH